MMKDELAGKIMTEFVGLKAKLYSYKMLDEKETKKCKGIKKSVVDKTKECGILNLSDSSGNGSHWTAWFKNADKKYYFDSFGVQPPLVYYNTEETQPRNQVFCGHLCLYVLKHLTLGKDLQTIINNLY